MAELEFEDDTPAPPPPRRQRKPASYEDAAKSEADAAFGAAVVPFQRPNYSTPVAPMGRTLPHSIEAEEFLLSCCMLDGADVISRCQQAGVTPESFYVGSHGVIFETAQRLFDKRAKCIDVSTIAEELKTTKRLDEVGGYPFLTQVSSRIPTTAQAGYFIEKVRELAALRALIRQGTAVVEDCYNFTGGIEEFATAAETRILSVTRVVRRESFAVAKPITEFTYPSGDDPGILLGGDDFLGRGGGMLFVSHAGAGKSSFVMDAVMSWAIGRPWAGIKSNGPLKTLVIQGEDSDRYVGKVVTSFVGSENLTREQVAMVARNCVIVKLRGISGAAFFSELERLIELHAPDLVVINPLYIYAEGDISKSESAQPFLVELDRVNRDARFGYIIVHHTGKPRAKDNKGQRKELDDWETIYLGFGSSFLANWPRCSALLEPKEGESGKYWLKLGKGGRNAGVTRKVQQGAGWRDEIVTRVALKHSEATVEVGGRQRPAIYWERDEESESAAEPAQDEESKRERNAGGRRPPKFVYSDFQAVVASHATGRDNRKGLNVLHRAIQAGCPISKGALFEILKDAVNDGLLNREAEDLKYYV